LDIRVLNAEVRKKHAQRKKAMDMRDEMIAYMDGGQETDFLDDRQLFRDRLEGVNQQVKQ